MVIFQFQFVDITTYTEWKCKYIYKKDLPVVSIFMLSIMFDVSVIARERTQEEVWTCLLFLLLHISSFYKY